MNLTEFINYRSHCPCCKTGLATGFVSDRRQIVRHENDRLVIHFPLDSLKTGQRDYRVAYSFSKVDNSFSVDFLTKDGIYMDKVSPLFLIERFRELHQNLKVFKFYRGCTLCRLYAYGSQQFDIDLRNATFSDLNIWSEKVLLSSPMEDGYRAYALTNFPAEQRSEVGIWKMEPEDEKRLYGYWEMTPARANLIKMNALFPLSSPKEMGTRLDKLLIFS